MNTIIENNKASIFKLCLENRVQKLYVFGSVLTENFSENSDIDFLVKFNENIPLLEYADNYFELLFAFEDLFNKKIDLISEKSLKNPYFIKEVNNTKQLVYAT
jgi:predicted nucleotidyltransferase